MAQPLIQVPEPVRLEISLSPDEWLTVLEIPIDMLPHFSSKPRKWLDYLGYALTGSDGTLSQLRDVEAVACDLDVPIAPGEVYYFHASGNIVFIDPDVFTTVSSHSSQARESGFRNVCDAAHLLAHAKGNEYIKLLTSMRTHEQLVIEEIDDPRNGLFVFSGIHKLMGIGSLAFLQTPIRSLKSSDIHEHAEPDAYRLTTHIFSEDSDARQYHHHGKAASRRSPLPDDWPPEVIFTTLYASAALRIWGKKDCKTRLAGITRKDYYPNDLQDKSAKDEEKKLRREERMKRKQQEPREPDGQDMIMALWSIFHDKAIERAKEAAESKSKQRSTEKVTSWLDEQ
ncbi:hypothetical protein DFH11DRAFT_1728611 [Phellopilus nigrolimitatus]|nr:hypothetical protein DFH11DRAFT_1728611 [Phellopilus nigrolimitatus]